MSALQSPDAGRVIAVAIQYSVTTLTMSDVKLVLEDDMGELRSEYLPARCVSNPLAASSLEGATSPIPEALYRSVCRLIDE